MRVAGLYERLPIPLQNLACTWAGYRRWRERFTPHFHETLASWEALDQASVERLHAIQLDRLNLLVERARRHVPHYRAIDLAPVESGTAPTETLAHALAQIPILEKESYRDAPESFLAEDVPRARLIESKTSGTTGTALPLWYTPEALAEEYAAVWRLHRRCGLRIRDPFFSFGGQSIVPLAQAKPPFWRRSLWRGQTLFSLYHMSEAFIPDYVDALHSLPADYAQGYPSSFYLLGRAMLDEGRPLPKGKLKVVLTSSESLLAYQREVIEEAFAAPVRDRYGTSEFVVSMTECSENNMHVDMEFGVVELDVTESTDEWERGEIIATGLGTYATPFLRYRVGDIGTRSRFPCPCGRPGEVFLEIDGRVEDYVVTPDGRWIGRLDHIFKAETDIAEAQILQEDARGIRILVVPRPSFDESSSASLVKEVRARLGEEIELDIQVVDSIAREANGKFRAVKSNVGRNGR